MSLSPARRVAAIIAGTLALLSLLLAIHVSASTAWMRVVLDASHGPIFAGVAILLAMLGAPARARVGEWPEWARFGKVLTLCIALGVLIECLQGLGGRPPSSFDVATDTAGALVGLALRTLAMRPGERAARFSSPGSWSVVALGLVGLAFVLWRPLGAAKAYAHRAAIFPAIVEFSAPVDRYFTTTAGVDTAIKDLPAPWSILPGERAIEVRYAPGHPPSVQIVEPRGDWRGYEVIAVDLTNAGPTGLSLVLRIHDARHDMSAEDRLNLPLVIPPGTRTTVRVSLESVASAPASRRMDMGRIANVMLYGHEPAAPGALYVSRIWLE